MSVTEQTAGAVATGVAGLTVALFGVPPDALMCGFVGAAFGLALPSELGRYRSAAIFLASIAGGPIIAAAISEYAFSGSPLIRNGLAILCSALLHPIMSAAAKRIDPLLCGWAVKFGAKDDA